MVRRTLYAHGFEAQLFRDSREQHFQFFHYIITHPHSAEILAWGQELTEEAAEKEALDCMQNLLGRAAGAG